MRFRTSFWIIEFNLMRVLRLRGIEKTFPALLVNWMQSGVWFKRAQCNFSVVIMVSCNRQMAGYKHDLVFNPLSINHYFGKWKNMNVYNLKLVFIACQLTRSTWRRPIFSLQKPIWRIFLIRFKSDFSRRSSRIIQDYAVI